LDESSLTDFSQEGGIMTGEILEPEINISNPNLGNTNNENSIINLNSDDQTDNFSRNQLQDFLNTVMQVIRTEIGALQEESKKQTAKLTSAVQSLRSGFKRENEKLAKSLTAKFEAEHDKIGEDFEVRLNSEILIVSERMENVRKDNENELVKLSPTIDEVYASVSEKIDTDITQTGEAMTQIEEYLDDKLRAVSGDMQQVRRNADEISKLNATLGEMQSKLASGNSNTPQSADSGNAIVRVTTTDQKAASASIVDTDSLPSTNGVNVSSNSTCHDSTSVVSQTINS
jgi:predicted RecB family endonuclease